MNDVMIQGMLKVVLTTGAVLFASIDTTADKMQISLSVAAPCMVFIGGCVWWLSSKFSKLESNDKETANRLTAMEARLNTLPCDTHHCTNKQQYKE